VPRHLGAGKEVFKEAEELGGEVEICVVHGIFYYFEEVVS